MTDNQWQIKWPLKNLDGSGIGHILRCYWIIDETVTQPKAIFLAFAWEVSGERNWAHGMESLLRSREPLI
jgi:hypothetical protein